MSRQERDAGPPLRNRVYYRSPLETLKRGMRQKEIWRPWITVDEQSGSRKVPESSVKVHSDAIQMRILKQGSLLIDLRDLLSVMLWWETKICMCRDWFCPSPVRSRPQPSAFENIYGTSPDCMCLHAQACLRHNIYSCKRTSMVGNCEEILKKYRRTKRSHYDVHSPAAAQYHPVIPETNLHQAFAFQILHILYHSLFTSIVAMMMVMVMSVSVVVIVIVVIFIVTAA